MRPFKLIRRITARHEEKKEERQEKKDLKSRRPRGDQ